MDMMQHGTWTGLLRADGRLVAPTSHMAARSAKLSVCGPVATELRLATDRRASSSISGAKACPHA